MNSAILFFAFNTDSTMCKGISDFYLFLSPFPTSTKFYLSGHDVNANTWIYVWDLHNASQSVCIFAIVTFVFAVHCTYVCVLYSTLHKIKIMKWKRNTNHTNSLIMAKMQIRSFFSTNFYCCRQEWRNIEQKYIFFFYPFSLSFYFMAIVCWIDCRKPQTKLPHLLWMGNFRFYKLNRRKS